MSNLGVFGGRKISSKLAYPEHVLISNRSKGDGREDREKSVRKNRKIRFEKWKNSFFERFRKILSENSENS